MPESQVASLNVPDLTPEQFGGTWTKHGWVQYFEDDSWAVYGHVTDEQLTEAINEAASVIDMDLKLDDELPFAPLQAWATLTAGHADDEWVIEYPDANTAETPGAFPVTTLSAI